MQDRLEDGTVFDYANGHVLSGRNRIGLVIGLVWVYPQGAVGVNWFGQLTGNLKWDC